VNAPHRVALVRAGAVFKKGKLIERADESGVVIRKSRDTPDGYERWLASMLRALLPE
jgi:hypothetical protein